MLPHTSTHLPTPRFMSAGLCGALFTAAALASGAAPPSDLKVRRASPQVQELAGWVLQSRDNRGQPFAIIDKTQAQLFVFQPEGQLRGASPVLLGSARGDDSVPGIGHRKIADILPRERTTPAGRFMVEPGHNAQGEGIFWIDYDAAISMHRVRVTNRSEHRLERLASASAADNRISYGCINVPVAFFNKVVDPSFSKRRGVVYVLPETRPSSVVFGALKAKTSKPGS